MCSFKSLILNSFLLCCYAVFLAWYGIGIDFYPMDDEKYDTLKKKYPSFAPLWKSKYKGELAVIHFIRIRNVNIPIGELSKTLLNHASHPILYMPWIGKLSQFDTSKLDSILVMRHRTVKDFIMVTEELKEKGIDMDVVFEENQQWAANGKFVGWLVRVFAFFVLFQIFHILPFCCCSRKTPKYNQRIRK